MNGRTVRIGLTIMLISLTSLEIAQMNGASEWTIIVLALIVLAGVAMFNIPNNHNT